MHLIERASERERKTEEGRGERQRGGVEEKEKKK